LTDVVVGLNQDTKSNWNNNDHHKSLCRKNISMHQWMIDWVCIYKKWERNRNDKNKIDRIVYDMICHITIVVRH
jgi:hypothetical protein